MSEQEAMMSFRLTIPARINILGNPSDAAEGDFATISAAVDMRAGAIVEPAAEIRLEMLKDVDGNHEPIRTQAFDRDQIPLPYDGTLDLVKGAINRLYRFSAEFREKLTEGGIRITTWTRVPRQSGLGGSSLFVLLALAGLRQRYELDPRRHNDYVLSELTQRVEDKELGITCGFADRYVPLFGGIAYLDYRGKLEQQEIQQEPYVTYERLDAWVDEIPLVAVSSGLMRDSGDVHGRMRPRYLKEYHEWQRRGGGMPPMVSFMTGAWETAWRGKIALLQQDWPTFGRLMNENHRLVDQMMTYCGFSDGAGAVNNYLIEMALNHGALGAKLTGAGSGGSVFALVPPGEEDALVETWGKAVKEAGLSHAHIYRPRISRQGLTIEKIGTGEV
jgi:galactokinase